MAEKVSAANVRSQFADVLNRVAYGGARVVVTKHDQDVAAVVPISDLEMLARLDQLCDLDEAKAALLEGEKGGLITLAQLKAQLKVT